jgi:rare lipoprotein A (peptidoglycan hydrolase)
MKKHCIGFMALGMSLTASSSAAYTSYKGVGIASYYDDAFNGCITANGEKFNQAQMTCAHLWLPLGSIVKVTNLKNHKSVILRVNDRGPYVDGRTIDLSKSAAELLDFTDDGLANVKIETMSYKSYLAIRQEEFTAGLMMGYGRNNCAPIENVGAKKVLYIPVNGRVNSPNFDLKRLDLTSSRIQKKSMMDYLVFIGIFYRPEKVSAFHDEKHNDIPDTSPLRFFESRSLAWLAP